MLTDYFKIIKEFSDGSKITMFVHFGPNMFKSLAILLFFITLILAFYIWSTDIPIGDLFKFPWKKG